MLSASLGRSVQLAIAGALSLASASASVPTRPDALQFFVGRTESHGTVKVLFKKAYRSSSVGQGRIEGDGSLALIQRVVDEGEPPEMRRWHIRQVGPGRFAGTMSEAAGPVTIVQDGDRYRFSFRMKGNLSVEQWLTPQPGNMSARTTTKVRRFGLTVATAEALIRKI
jgi:hypothetical protein